MAIIALAILAPLLAVAVPFLQMAFVFTGWFLAILAFISGNVSLGLILLGLWIIALGASE